MQAKLSQIVLSIAHENPEFRHRLAREIRLAVSFPREFYLPSSVRGTRPLTPEGTDLEIWKWEDQPGRFSAVAFAAKQQKPLWNLYFRNEAQRERQIQDTVDKRKRALEFKNKRIQEKKQFIHDIQVGDILYSSWGFNQTNVDFYQVTRLLGKQIEIRKIGKQLVREDKGVEYVVPTPNRFAQGSQPMRKTPQLGGRVKITQNTSASKWDGKPKYQTGFGYGH